MQYTLHPGKTNTYTQRFCKQKESHNMFCRILNNRLEFPCKILHG